VTVQGGVVSLHAPRRGALLRHAVAATDNNRLVGHVARTRGGKPSDDGCHFVGCAAAPIGTSAPSMTSLGSCEPVASPALAAAYATSPRLAMTVPLTLVTATMRPQPTARMKPMTRESRRRQSTG